MGFNLAKLDAVAIDFDLLVKAAEKLNLSGFRVASQIAGLIQAFTRRKWIEDKPFGG